MELHNKDLSTLFEQLGLPADQASMDAFFASHSLDHDTFSTVEQGESRWSCTTKT